MMNNSSAEDIKVVGLQYMNNARDNFSFNFDLSDRGPAISHFMHYHDFYEISFYFGKNPAVYIVGNEKYSVNYGDIVICDMFEPHMFFMSDNEGYERLAMGINASMLLSLSSDENDLVQIFDRKKRLHPILHVSTVQFSKYLDIIKILRSNDIKHGVRLLERALAIQMLTYLYEDTYEDRADESANVKSVSLISEIKKYIDIHINGPITLADLAVATNYSESYLCRVFKSLTGKTLVQYINDKRIQNAKELLSSPLSIAEIAIQTGFDNYAYFYRVFKKATGFSPKDYREKIIE